MIITTIDELRLAFPAHALDDVRPLAGFINNSEHELLVDKLGRKLYKQVVAAYKSLDVETYLSDINNNNEQKPMTHLIALCQRAVAFDAMSRAIGVQAVSLSNMGVNMATADDYGTPSKDMLDLFKNTCSKETRICINQILEYLEELCRDNAAITDTTAMTDTQKEAADICEAWKESRYYFLAADVLIPSATVLQQYLDIYGNREKFISMLPDIRYIQDEQIAPLIGEDFCNDLCRIAVGGTDNKTLATLISRLRRCLAAYLEERTSIITVSKDRKIIAHTEGERHINAAVEYCRIHQDELEKMDVISTSVPLAPWYEKADACGCDEQPKFRNNEPGNVMFVLPGMN